MAIVKTDIYDVQAPFPLDLRTVVPNIAGRDNLSVGARYNGMPVWVVSEAKAYRLVGGNLADNDNWVQVWPDPSGGAGTITVNTNTPTGGENGDSWFRQDGPDVHVHQKVAGVWTDKGSFMGGGRMFTHTASGDGETSVFTVPHGLPYTPTMVIATPNTRDAKGMVVVGSSNTVDGVNFHCTVDATDVIITYESFGTGPTDGPPRAGTNNLKWTILVS